MDICMQSCAEIRSMFYLFPVKCLAGIMFKWVRDFHMHMICKHAIHKSKKKFENYTENICFLFT